MIIPHFETPDDNDWSNDYIKYQKSKKKMRQEVKIKTDEQNPQPMELVAQAIIDVANYAEKVKNGRLRQETIIVLIHDQTGIAKRDIRIILDTMPKLKDIYTKELKKEGKS